MKPESSDLDARGRAGWAARFAAMAPDFSASTLLDHVRTNACPAGAVLLRGDTVVDGIWLLVDGAARLSYFRHGREHVGDFFVEGDTCTNYSSLVTRTPGRLWITTTEPTVVAWLPWRAVEEAGRVDPLGIERVRRVVAERLAVEFAGTIWSFLMDSPADRYRALLRDRPAWIARFPQYMIASYLGLSPEGLSKLRRRIGERD